MKRTALAVLASLALAACSSDIDQAKQAVTDSLVITTDLEFGEVSSYGGDVVCGSYSAYASYKEPRQLNQPFIVVAGKLDKRPSEDDWQFFCNEDHVTALLELTGVGPFSADSGELIQITRDMGLLASALEAYYKDNFSFPTEAQGLQALVAKPEGARPLPRYREGGYLQAIPTDPWDRAYEYSVEQWGRTRGTFTLTTRGKSAEVGGAGREADVSSQYLPYLQHTARVLGLQ